jgi:hypothetical protein
LPNLRHALRCAVLLALAFVALAGRADAAPGLKVGLIDSTQTLYGDPTWAFPVLDRLNVQVLRVNLSWGGRWGVAGRRPANGADPADPAYNWALYDRAARYAAQYRIEILFTIVDTPDWANAGLGQNHAPAAATDLRDFAAAAARRYSGAYPDRRGAPLPPVRLWAAWNEPNNPIFLAPQFRRVGSRWIVQSAVDYARICSAVYDGVHSTLLAGEKVACGGTAPRGNNAPRSGRPSTSPLSFLRALRARGPLRFDAYDHHPYARGEAPGTRPSSRGEVTLGNIGDLTADVIRLFGPQRIWISEYGYETSPPDGTFGVSLQQQARYVEQSFAIARRNPLVDLMIWFLLRDETRPTGWQSGLITADGREKPSFEAFARLTKP